MERHIIRLEAVQARARLLTAMLRGLTPGDIEQAYDELQKAGLL